MADSISVRGLTNEQVDALKRLVKLFRQRESPETLKPTGKEIMTKEAEEGFPLGSRSSDVIGSLTRDVIYEGR